MDQSRPPCGILKHFRKRGGAVRSACPGIGRHEAEQAQSAAVDFEYPAAELPELPELATRRAPIPHKFHALQWVSHGFSGNIVMCSLVSIGGQPDWSKGKLKR